MAQGLFTRVVRRPPGAVIWVIALLIALTPWLAGARALAGVARSDQAILFLGRDFTGPSKTWSLRPDQPFLAVPYTGDEFRPVSASIKVGADVGVVLFGQPFFSTVDETCEYRLGTADDTRLWWRSDKVQFVPGTPAQGPVEANLRPQEIASLILYRRDLGPPPGALLLERRRYVNWDCAAPTKARGYKRLFVPVAAAPHRQGCFGLDVQLSYGDSGTVALDFSAASELLLLVPGDLGADYAEIDHRFTVGLHDTTDCSGTPASVAHPQAGTRRFELKQFGLDRKVRALTLRYDRGAYDAMLLAAAEEAADAGKMTSEPPSEAAAEEIRAETAAEPTVQAAPETAAGDPEPDAGATGSTAAGGSGESETAAGPPTEPSPDPAPETVAETVPEAAPQPALETARETAGETAGDPASETASHGAADEPEAAAVDALSPAGETMPMIEAPQAETPRTDAPRGATSEDETTGFLVLPESGPEPEGDGQTDRQTFKFPLLQGYRLSACLHLQEDCGEPAASEWCRARGFAGGAAAFEIDENIGSLFPTLALGDLQLCANFVCDGFKEITCVP